LFAVDTATLPLAPGMDADDPRAALRWFPRHSDQDAVDACNSGLSGQGFSCGSGPVMRMVVSLNKGTVAGANIVPGGQSGIQSSPHFRDQLELWLANETVPMRFSPKDVAAGAEGRESLLPSR
jgi:hypothetical protein